jgi:hypothetical protein
VGFFVAVRTVGFFVVFGFAFACAIGFVRCAVAFAVFFCNWFCFCLDNLLLMPLCC